MLRVRLGPSRLGGAALSAALAVSSPSTAEEPRRAVLAYRVDPGIDGCFETKELEDAVAARLGYLPFVVEAPLRLDAHIRRQGAGLSAALEVQEGSTKKQRELGSATRDCGELSRALALAISVAIDPMSLTRAPASAAVAPEPAPEPADPTPPPRQAPSAEAPAPPPTATAPPVAPPAPKPPDPVPARGAELDAKPRVRFLATGQILFLALPSTTAGGSLGLGLRWRALWTDAELRYASPGAAEAAEGGSVSAGWLGGTLAACHGNRRLGICALGAVARLAAEGQEVAVPRNASALWAGVGARASLELPLFGPVFARAHIDGLYRLTPLQLELRKRTVWEAGPVSIVPGLGLGGQL